MSVKNNVLSTEEYEKLWKAARSGDDLDRVLFVCMAQLGMRRGEVANLTEDWVDFQSKQIKIPERQDDWTPKTPQAARRIPYSNLTKAERVIPNFFEFNERVKMSGRGIYKRVKKWGRRAKLKKDVFPHALRATAATKFASAGFSAQALRSIMGWADLETANRYIKHSSRAVEEDLKRYGENIK